MKETSKIPGEIQENTEILTKVNFLQTDFKLQSFLKWRKNEYFRK